MKNIQIFEFIEDELSIFIIIYVCDTFADENVNPYSPITVALIILKHLRPELLRLSLININSNAADVPVPSVDTDDDDYDYYCTMTTIINMTGDVSCPVSDVK